jgi:hypothetical protein
MSDEMTMIDFWSHKPGTNTRGTLVDTLPPGSALFEEKVDFDFICKLNADRVVYCTRVDTVPLIDNEAVIGYSVNEVDDLIFGGDCDGC